MFFPYLFLQRLKTFCTVLHQKTATKNYKLDYKWNQAKQNYILKPCYQKVTVHALSFCDNDYVIRKLSMYKQFQMWEIHDEI